MGKEAKGEKEMTLDEVIINTQEMVDKWDALLGNTPGEIAKWLFEQKLVLGWLKELKEYRIKEGKNEDCI